MLHAMVRDDRARRTRLLDRRQLSHTLDPVSTSRIKWARAELRAATLVFRITFFGITAWLTLVGLDAAGAPFGICALVGTLGLLVFLLTRTRLATMGTTRRLRRVAHQLADHGLCPTCAYRTADLPQEPDGCVVCPECAGAWRRAGAAAAPPREDAPVEPNLALRVRAKSRWKMIIKDDRGWTVPAMRLPIETILAGPWSDAQRARLTSAAESARRATQRARRWLAAYFLLLTASLIGVASYAATLLKKVISDQPLGGNTETIIGSIVGVFVLMLLLGAAFQLRLALLHLGSREWFSYPKGRRSLAREAFCAACLADLIAREADLDGCTTCPECGAAWRLIVPSA